MSGILPSSVPQDVPVGSTQQIGAPEVTQSVYLLAADAGYLNGLGPTAAQLSGGVPIYANSDPSALTGLLDGALVVGTGSNSGKWYTSDGSGNPIKWMENGVITATITVDSVDLGDNDPINFGDANDIVMKWNGTYFAVTQATPNSEIRLGVSGAGIDFQMFGDTVGADSLWDQSADSQKYGDNAKVVLGTGLDLTMYHDGTDNLFVGANGDIVIDNTDVNDAIILRVGADSSATTIDLRNNSDVSLFSMIPSGAAAGDFKGLDNADFVVGTGNDFRINHNGTLTTITSTTGNLVIDNTAATGATYLDLGTDTSATEAAVRNNSGSRLFKVTGDGAAELTGTLTAGGLTTAGTVQVSDGGLLLQLGAGTGTGDKIACLGVDATHGIATYVYQATVSPAAVETALFTIPAMSVVDSVQSNVQTALTGGGTTVTHSIGITGDVDAYGTASNSGVQADLLTQNAKINTLGTTTNAGASIGVWSAATVSLKLIAAATGGAAVGDTALTAGSVLVRVVYRTLLPLANA